MKVGTVVPVLFGLAAGLLARAGERPIVAVFDVELRGAELSAKLGDEVRDNLSEYLGGLMSAKGYQVVPRAQLKERLRAQQAESYKACYDQSCQVELGRELSAEKSLATQVFALGGECRVVVTLYDLKRAASDGAGLGVGACDEPGIVRALEKAVDELGGGAAASSAEAPPPAAAPGPDAAGLEWVFSQAARVQFTESEITVGQYRSCVQAGTCEAPRSAEGCNWGRAARIDHPINCVNLAQATAFCAWAGGRLPTHEEFQAEASAGGARVYPWGDSPPSCLRVIWGGEGPGCGRGGTWPVCAKPLGNSTSGLCDFCGNAQEWTSTSKTLEHDGKLYHLLYGQAWNTDVWNVKVVPAHGVWTGPGNALPGTGFRCCRGVRF